MKVDVIGIKQLTEALQKAVEATVASTAEVFQVAAKKNTPIRSGNARRNWNKSTRKDGFSVENRVPYIERLNAGSSKQRPRGIVGPTLTETRRKLK